MDQKKYWENQHRNRKEEFKSLENTPNSFAVDCVKYIKDGSLIIEIGIVNGRDARYFIKNKNASVIGVDISEEAIHQLEEAAKKDDTFDNITPIVSDVRNLFEKISPSKQIDSFYARSALHLRGGELAVFMNDLNKFMKKDGYIFLQGKTEDDYKIKRSSTEEADYKIDIDGHERRAWSKENFEELCNNYGYKPIRIDETSEVWEGKTVNFIGLIAQKI